MVGIRGMATTTTGGGLSVAEARECYYLDGARNQQGPVAVADIVGLIGNGTIRRDTLIWYAGMPDWRAAGQVSEFASLFAQATPPRPPAAALPPQPRQAQAQRYPAAATDRMGPERMAPERIFPAAADGAPSDRLIARWGVWGLFGRALLSGLGTLVIVPAPWTSTALYRYLGENTWLPDGRRLTFAGQPGDIWYIFVGIPLLFVLGLIPFAFLITLPLVCFLNYLVFRWVCAKIGSEDGAVKLEFTGGFWGYFGWALLLGLSGITIIGWAWVAKFFFRWLCRNVSGTLNFDFVGTGWGILWRYFLVALASSLLIPIPWVIRWYSVWLVSQVRVENPAAHFD
jgi:GYF domain 2